LCFAGICFPHADDAACVASLLEVEAPLGQRSRPFGRVELDADQN
jgi:hypothetical protein